MEAGGRNVQSRRGGQSEGGNSVRVPQSLVRIAPVNGKLPYDILLEECDPKLVKMEMDLCWIYVGGQDPFKYFKKYPGRFPLVHVKDLTKIPKVDASGRAKFRRLTS